MTMLQVHKDALEKIEAAMEAIDEVRFYSVPASLAKWYKDIEELKKASSFLDKQAARLDFEISRLQRGCGCE